MSNGSKVRGYGGAKVGAQVLRLVRKFAGKLASLSGVLFISTVTDAVLAEATG